MKFQILLVIAAINICTITSVLATKYAAACNDNEYGTPNLFVERQTHEEAINYFKKICESQGGLRYVELNQRPGGRVY